MACFIVNMHVVTVIFIELESVHSPECTSTECVCMLMVGGFSVRLHPHLYVYVLNGS